MTLNKKKPNRAQIKQTTNSVPSYSDQYAEALHQETQKEAFQYEAYLNRSGCAIASNTSMVVGTYADQYAEILLQETKKSIIQYNNYLNRGKAAN